MKRIIHVPSQVLEKTLVTLREAGNRDAERLVLWIGRTKGNFSVVSSVLIPEQIASVDFFRVPPNSMAQIVATLREQRNIIVAQVHSHPGEAFHSPADDKWALISRVGALSIVLPRFALGVDKINFFTHAKLFVLSEHNSWIETPTQRSESDAYEY